MMKIATLLCVMLLALAFVATGAPASNSTELRYGIVKQRVPVELSSGLFGMSKKEGFAYSIALQQSGGDLEVKSPNSSFLVGDCVSVVGDGKKTTLERTQPKQCGAASEEARSDFLSPSGGLQGAGGSGATCEQARKEVENWPPGLGRRRALLRELEACHGSNGALKDEATKPDDQCSKAWAQVESLPFGPERAEARSRARAACAGGGL